MQAPKKIIHFELHSVPTNKGVKVFIEGNCNSGNKNKQSIVCMACSTNGKWKAMITLDNKSRQFRYRYFVQYEDDVRIWDEWADRSISWPESIRTITCIDHWNDPSAPESVLLKNPFKEALSYHKKDKTLQNNPSFYTHEFRVNARPATHEVVCLLGNFLPGKHWDTKQPLLMHWEKGYWMVKTNIPLTAETIEYKYGIYHLKEKRFLYYEEGLNRILSALDHQSDITVISDSFFRVTLPSWKGAGVAIPVFSLRSESSTGIGEFADLKLLVDWAVRSGFKLIQLLPVNDTTASHSWSDSYPYAAISAFALNPVYISLEKAGRLPENDPVWKKYKKQKKLLAQLPEIDYEKTLRLKWEYLRALFTFCENDFLKSPVFRKFFKQHRHWLIPYAAFCYLRDKYGTADYARFEAMAVYDEQAVEQLTSPSHPDYEEVAIHYFVQFHLHRQLQEMTRYAHKKGVTLKGDIPIGIFRNSVEAWMYPDQFNLDHFAGAPPDGFAIRGQNWGFPTYNWKVMEAGGFSWWKKRLQHLAQYFDAVRYDHILGFFRIWQIPSNQVEGIMGYFSPDIPYSKAELESFGVMFNAERFCQPFISPEILEHIFEENTGFVSDTFLERPCKEMYTLKTEFSTQQKIAQYFQDREGMDNPLPDKLRRGLFDLISNILFFPVEEKEGYFRPRFNFMQTASFHALPPAEQDKLRLIHDEYFYGRHDKFWQKEAMRKLPVLKSATGMLACGEDLGMVPGCVPGVMHELGLLSLEVQRMPKKWGHEFTGLDGVPYLSVVTPGTHDMSTLRAWWEEDREKTQRFYHQVLHHDGHAPHSCEPWIVKEIVAQHFHSPAMWAIIQLQDLLGMSADLRYKNPQDERINVPANARHYWRYRMHISLERLLTEDAFNGDLHKMIGEAGR